MRTCSPSRRTSSAGRPAWVRWSCARAWSCEPLQRGGGQERRLRAGTENLPGIVGLGAALDHATDWLQIGRWRDRLETACPSRLSRGVHHRCGCRAAAQRDLPRHSGSCRRDPADGTRSRRCRGEQRGRLLLGQGQPVARPGCDGPVTRPVAVRHPGQPRLVEHDRRCRCLRTGLARPDRSAERQNTPATARRAGQVGSIAVALERTRSWAVVYPATAQGHHPGKWPEERRLRPGTPYRQPSVPPCTGRSLPSSRTRGRLAHVPGGPCRRGSSPIVDGPVLDLERLGEPMGIHAALERWL